MTNLLDTLIQELISSCQHYGMDPESFIREKLQEIEERGRALSTPRIQWFRGHASEYNVYVSRAFQRELSPEESTGQNSFLDRLKRRYNPEPREGFAGDGGLRENLLSESNGRCKSCGTRLDYDSIRIDHVLPLAEGGSNLRGYLQACVNRVIKERLIT